jgi:hypothetical protein
MVETATTITTFIPLSSRFILLSEQEKGVCAREIFLESLSFIDPGEVLT